jgi:3-oxoacyl-[acyl-carrier protein] reductase
MSFNNSKDKVVLVTGVSKGVGRELFKQLSLSPDIMVIGLSRDKVLLDQLHIICTEIGGRDFHLLEMDLAQNSISKELTEILNSSGRLDVLINNAGTIVNKPFHQITNAELISCYSTNVFAPFSSSTAIIAMVERISVFTRGQHW